MAEVGGTAIGIDLGTTYSCVAVYKDGKVQIIENEQGKRTTPSCVGFNEEERLIGEQALDQVSVNPLNTVFDAKRLIGRRFEDITEEDKMHWPFKVISDDGKPKIEVEFKGETEAFYPEEISAMVLVRMKETAEAYLGKTVTDAVITVPAYFNDAQRCATKSAGEIAGFNVLRLINEPTAAAIAYGLGKKVDSRTILVFDLGGGKFDVSLVRITKRDFQVKAVSGDTHLGGHDIDNQLVKYLATEFKTKNKKDLSKNKKTIRRLRVHCEKAKRVLSTNPQARIEIESLFEGLDFRTTVKRTNFERINQDLFGRLLEITTSLMQESNMKKCSIDEVVLVGGSTRIPKIQQKVKDFFNDKKLNKSINADEAVAYGAAIMAASLSRKLEGKKLQVQDVIPLSLQIGNKSDEKIKKNTLIPIKKTVDLLYTGMEFPIYESDYSSTNILGNFKITGNLPDSPRVVFNVDHNGILTVKALEEGSKSTSMSVNVHKSGRFSDEQIDEMVKKAENIKKEEEMFRRKDQEHNELESFVYKVKSSAEQAKVQRVVSEEEIDETLDKCEQVLKWLKENKDAESSAVQNQRKNLTVIWNHINSKVHESYFREVKSRLEDEKRRTAVHQAEVGAALDKCNHILQWLQSNKINSESSTSQREDLEMMWNSVKSKEHQKSSGLPDSQNQVKEELLPEQPASLPQVHAFLDYCEEVVMRSELDNDKEAKKYQPKVQAKNEVVESQVKLEDEQGNVRQAVRTDEIGATLGRCIHVLQQLRHKRDVEQSAVHLQKRDLEKLWKIIQQMEDQKSSKK